MKYVIDENLPIPAYLQLYNQLRKDIVDGAYAFGSKLPSKRTLATETGVSTVTVEHACDLLRDEGYIEPRERSGYFVAFCSDDGFVTLPPSSFDVFSHKPPVPENADEFPFSVLARAMRKVIGMMGEGILVRSPNSGCVELRKAIQMYLAHSRGIEADVEQIVIGSGSEYLYSLIIELLGRNRVYAIEYPSYNKIEQVYSLSGAKIQKLPLSKNGIESSALQSCSADALHISPYRSYPSGVTASASKRHEYLKWAEKEDRYIIEDDFESEFSVSRKPEETLFCHSARDNVIYMNTFSKTVSSSLRVGYMVLPKHLSEEFEERLGFYSCTVPTYIQFVLAELIANGDFERHINRVRRKKRRQLTQSKDL
ncbi:MAG: PLP-dependent aminotransferase family protein [Clostridia bacterium]|nr:PLP-dependent aminotransferase family protein [Clostridia bacterium]